MLKISSRDYKLKTSDIIDYPKKMFDDISLWISDNAHLFRKKLLVFSPKTDFITKSFNIEVSDTSQFKKHKWMQKMMAFVQSNGRYTTLVVELHNEQPNNTAANYSSNGKTNTIKLFNANNTIKSGTIYISLKHELIHMMQSIMSDLIYAKRMFEDTSSKYHGMAGLPKKYDPKKYMMYDTKSVNEKSHSISDVEFFTRLNDEIELLKYKFKNKKINKNKVIEFVSDSDFFKAIYKQDIHKYRKALREVFRIFEKDLNVTADNKLRMYTKKRDFGETTEPPGKMVGGNNRHRFVIQNHKATKHHWDLRLENDDGTLSSWALPKHSLPSGNEKLLAVKTEDHPIDYIKFEGDIQSGQYGSGNIKIHDSGSYSLIEWSKNKIKFKLNGKKEKDSYILIRTDGKNWLIMKQDE